MTKATKEKIRDMLLQIINVISADLGEGGNNPTPPPSGGQTFTNQKFPLTYEIAFINQNNKDDINKLVNRSYGQGRYTVYNPLITPYRVTFDLKLGGITSATPKQILYQWNTGATTNQKYYLVKADGTEVLLHTFTQGQYGGSNPVTYTINIPSNLQSVATKIILESQSAAGDFPDWFEIVGDYTFTAPAMGTVTPAPLKYLLGVDTKMWDISFNNFPDKEAPIAGMVAFQRLYGDHNLTFNESGTLTPNGFWKQRDNMLILKNQDGVQTKFCYLDFPEYPYSVASRYTPSTYQSLAQRVYQICTDNKNNGRYFSIMEIGNELNKWYGGNPAVEWMDGASIACMMSMCYDGHKGQFANCGAKSADSLILVSNPGLATSELDIWYQMTEWVIANRGRRGDGTPDFPFDVYSFHMYSSLGGQHSGSFGGVPPEITVPLSGMVDQFRRVNEYRKKVAPWVKIHVGEWGWDIASDSQLNAPAFGSYSAWQTCSMWAMRALFAMVENEIYGSAYFRIAQDWPNNDANGTIFATMALNRQESDGTQDTNGVWHNMGMHRTMTGDYFHQVMEFFGASDFVFNSRVSSSPFVFKFKKGTKDVYIIWQSETMVIPPNNARPVFTERTGTYNLNITGTKRQFVDDGSGVMSSTAFSGGNVPYGSKPVIIVQS